MRSWHWRWGLLAVGLGLASWVGISRLGAAPARVEVEIHPLTEIVVTPPQISDITADSARLTFTTTLPVACSVVYGVTESFGALALDPDMAGGPVVDHDLLLGGLPPDSTIYYRVQAVGEDGVIYVDEVFTFETLPAAPLTEVNLAALAAGATILDVSSNFGGAANHEPWGANSAIDDNAATAWSSDGDGDDAYIEVGLSQAGQPQAVEVWTRRMGDGTAQIFEFSLTADTGATWGPFTLPDANQAYRFPLEVAEPISALRLDVVSSSGGNIGLHTLAVWEQAPPGLFLPISPQAGP